MREPHADEPLRTVAVPEALAPVFRRAQEFVRRYFGDRLEDPETASVVISGERYVLVRAASLSVEFFDLVTSLYADQGAEQAASVARNLVYDLAHSIGRADARAFHEKMSVVDPVDRLSAGPVHFAYAGWAFVAIDGSSRPAPDDSYFLRYAHPFSFEADAWIRRGRRTEFPVCWMNAGYSSGWCEESFRIPLVAVEVECRARGDVGCRFLMAPPHRIEEHLARYVAEHGGAETRHRGTGATPFTIPEYFQRKRMEEAMRRANEELERRVADRTRDLEEANRRLQQEMVERELAEEERRRVQAKLLQAQKLESLGAMSGGLAHDFNNLLVAIIGNAGLALQELADDSPVRDAVVAIEDAAVRAADLTRQLLAYAGKGAVATEPIELSRLVEDMRELLAAAAGKTARIEFSLTPGLPPADADPSQVRQIVMNLVTNAAEAIGMSPGRIVVRTGQQHADRAWLADTQLGTSAEEGEYLFIEVQDDGHGMHPATQARIFDPFFTTKFTGRGLGLAAVLGIVRAHRGAIKVTSAPGTGTAMRVLLPAAPVPVRAEAPGAVAAARSASAGATVLVVDDEATVRSVARKVLEREGFAVVVAEGGVEALRIVRERPAAVDLVLLDMTMPDMSGPVTLQELRRLRSDLRIILSSGYTEADTLPQVDGESVPFIQKPYRPAELVAAIRRALA
jgi:signal transduction histidine kinase/predicted hydrocarbon binding protein